MASNEKVKIHGSCQCGFIKYEFHARPDPATGKFKGTRCNCTFCQKFSTTNLSLDGPDDFKLLSPASREELGDYAPRIKTVHRYFCKNCAAHVWMEGFYEFDGHKEELFNVNLATVDQPQENIELNNVQLAYFDMLHENFAGGLADKPWAGGLY